MVVQVRYRPMELSEGIVETFPADDFEILQDNTIRLVLNGEPIGFIHPERWDSIVVLIDSD